MGVYPPLPAIKPMPLLFSLFSHPYPCLSPCFSSQSNTVTDKHTTTTVETLLTNTDHTPILTCNSEPNVINFRMEKLISLGYG